MKRMKKLVALLMIAVMCISVAACGNKKDSAESSEKASLAIAYQSSIAYAPLLVMKEKKLIEKHYGKDIEIDWQELANGAAINEAFTAGTLDIGTMGVGPAVTGIMAGLPYKIFTGLSSQPYAVLTNQEDIKTLKDIKSDNIIAITGLGSQPHVLLAMAAKAELGDAKALDSNLQVLPNADGYTSIKAGSVQCHMVISPYNFMEEKEENIHEIEIGEDVWPNGNTFIVGVASKKLQENTELYDAVCKATEEAMTYVAENPEETAKILAAGYPDATEEEILSWMADERSNYTTKLQGVMDLSNFMVEEGFLEKGPSDISEIVYDNVEGN